MSEKFTRYDCRSGKKIKAAFSEVFREGKVGMVWVL